MRERVIQTGSELSRERKKGKVMPEKHVKTMINLIMASYIAFLSFLNPGKMHCSQLKVL